MVEIIPFAVQGGAPEGTASAAQAPVAPEVNLVAMEDMWIPPDHEFQEAVPARMEVKGSAAHSSHLFEIEPKNIQLDGASSQGDDEHTLKEWRHEVRDDLHFGPRTDPALKEDMTLLLYALQGIVSKDDLKPVPTRHAEMRQKSWRTLLAP